MTTFELIPYRLYLSQCKTWMHRIKAEIKIYIVTLLWVSIFIFSYFKLFIIALSLIIVSFTIRSKQNIIQRHLLQTLFMTLLTTVLSFSVSTSYKYYSEPKQTPYSSCSNIDTSHYSYDHTSITMSHKVTRNQIMLVLKPPLYFFLTLYSIKLVMITTAPEILVITFYKSKILNKLLDNDLLFTFLLSSHIVTNITNKIDKVIQVAHLRGKLNLRKSSTKLILFGFLIFQAFFLEIIRESKEISKALYTRNLNQENNNFLRIYTASYRFSDGLHITIGTLYFLILALV